VNVLLFQNAPAPYRTPLFRKLGDRFDLTVVYGTAAAGDRFWSADTSGYRSLTLKGRNIRIKGKVLTWAKGIGRHLRDHPYDAYVISDDWRCILSSLTIARAARKRGKPVVLWCGAIDTPYRRNAMIPRPVMAVHHFLMRRMTRHVHAYLAYGPKTADFFRKRYKIPSERIVWGTQAVESDEGERIPEKEAASGRLTFFFLGYLEERKGLGDLIRAVRGMPRNDFRLVVAGKGKDEAKFKAAAAGDHRIEFPGYVEGEAKRKCLREADVMVSPTYHDPWANTINEACVYGLPIITTPAEGSEGSLALDGFNARIVPQGDIDKLRGALDFFLENKSAIPAMGKNSRSLAEKFTIGWVVENFARAVQIALRDKQDD